MLPRSQVTLKQREGQTDETGTVIRAYHPTSTATLPGGSTIGLRSPYVLDVNSIVGPLSNATTPGGGTLLRAIAPYGFNSTDDNMQLDHVQEIQYGGQDVLANLWPLQSSRNSAKGGQLANALVEFPRGERIRIPLLKRIPNRQFYFKIIRMGASDAQ
jgi:hypothetical protein